MLPQPISKAEANGRSKLSSNPLLAGWGLLHFNPHPMHTNGQMTPQRRRAMGDEEEEEYDFEYSDDDEAEPDVEVRTCAWFGCMGGVTFGT